MAFVLKVVFHYFICCTRSLDCALLLRSTFDTEPLADSTSNTVQVEAICCSIPCGQGFLSGQHSGLRRCCRNAYSLGERILFPYMQSGLIFMFQPAMLLAKHFQSDAHFLLPVPVSTYLPINRRRQRLRDSCFGEIACIVDHTKQLQIPYSVNLPLQR
jgi:hypothetical protein